MALDLIIPYFELNVTDHSLRYPDLKNLLIFVKNEHAAILLEHIEGHSPFLKRCWPWMANIERHGCV